MGYHERNNIPRDSISKGYEKKKKELAGKHKLLFSGSLDRATKNPYAKGKTQGGTLVGAVRHNAGEAIAAAAETGRKAHKHEQEGAKGGGKITSHY